MPHAAEAWRVDFKEYDDAIKEAEVDLSAADQNDTGMAYSEAETFLFAQGTSIVDSAVAAVKQRGGTYGTLGDAASTFAYTEIDPPSWCDVTDDSFGAKQIRDADLGEQLELRHRCCERLQQFLHVVLQRVELIRRRRGRAGLRAVATVNGSCCARTGMRWPRR